MSAIRQILVPVDFSEPSKAAVDYAAMLAKTFGAKLRLVGSPGRHELMPRR